MATITLSVPDDIREKMKEHDKVNWSAVAREAVVKYMREIEHKEQIKKLLAKDEEQLDWTIELGRKAKLDQLARLRKKGYRL